MSVLAIAIAAATTVTRYHCSMEAPKALVRDAAATTLADIGMGQTTADDWRFDLSLSDGSKGADATIKWPKDPIQLASKFAALPTADGSYSFVAFSGGPCMFTDSACMSLVNMVRQADSSMKFVVLPTALATDPQKQTRAPFIVVAEGSCTENKR